jgi:hypothetical protein
MGRGHKETTYYDRCDVCCFIVGEDTEGPLRDCDTCDNEACENCCVPSLISDDLTFCLDCLEKDPQIQKRDIGGDNIKGE